jgi:hypothetical protein
MKETRPRTSWLEWFIVVSCAAFVFILALSAAYNHSILVLHFFQALTYVAGVILTLRRSAWGYGAGRLIAAFWNWTNIFYTTFIANGLRALGHLLQTGQLARPDQLMAVIAAAAHFALIAPCVMGYFRINPRGACEPIKFLAGGIIAAGYFGGIIILFGQQYIPLMRRVFRI